MFESGCSKERFHEVNLAVQEHSGVWDGHGGWEQSSGMDTAPVGH